VLRLVRCVDHGRSHCKTRLKLDSESQESFACTGCGSVSAGRSCSRCGEEHGHHIYELHRTILVTQQMRFSRVMKTGDWIKQL
jgi:hypothetical protein